MPRQVDKSRSVDNEKLREFPRAHLSTANAWLNLVDLKAKVMIGEPLPLWIHELETSFSITGSFAQSVDKRDFYPRNFNQPTWTFRGQTHNEHEYSHIGEFIRNGQIRAIEGDALFIIGVNGGGIPAKRNMKGTHQGTKLQGYISGVRRRHERWVNAPEYQFEFVVARHLAGPIVDAPVVPKILKDWKGLYRGGGFIDDPDEAYSDKQKLVGPVEGAIDDIVDSIQKLVD